MTPRNPWSFFLNFFWSKICTVSTLESLTLTSNDSFQSVGIGVSSLFLRYYTRD